MEAAPVADGDAPSCSSRLHTKHRRSRRHVRVGVSAAAAPALLLLLLLLLPLGHAFMLRMPARVLRRLPSIPSAARYVCASFNLPRTTCGPTPSYPANCSATHAHTTLQFDPNKPNRTTAVISIKSSPAHASVIAAGGQGFYGDDFDPLFFEDDQPITESLTWKRQREQQREQQQHRRRVEDGAPEENQEAFWKRKDR